MNTETTVHLATDHAGFTLKEEIRSWLEGAGYIVVDHGASSYDESDDFPDFIGLAAEAVSAAPEQNKAIIFGGSGQGEAMMANRFSGVRAAVYYGGSTEIIKLSRQHNNANILSIGARFVQVEEARSVVDLWLKTEPLADAKYTRRNEKLDTLS